MTIHLPFSPSAPTLPSWARMPHDERLSRIKELNDLDLSAADIASLLETTPSAVRGIAFRAGLRLSGATVVRRPAVEWDMADEVAEETWAPLGPSVRLVDLDENTCRWPVGQEEGSAQQFCGCQSVKRSSYCAAHAKMGRAV